MATITDLQTAVGSRARGTARRASRARPRRRSRVGSIVDGRFLIDARLAAGGFGTIYRATHLATGTAVALKILHGEHAADPGSAARFRREASLLLRLRDPHTVATYELGAAPDGSLYIAMELLRGDSLLARLRAVGRLPWRRALAIARGVCSSLAEVHALGVVHRDLKPGNLHLETRGDRDDFVKVLDFGIAKIMHGSRLDDGTEELTHVGEAVGTLEYMAPEQLAGAPCDARTDIYGLGLVVYEMVVGRRPFAGVSPVSLLAAVVSQTAMPPSVVLDEPVPPGLDRLVLRCLDRDAARRFTGARELAAAIDRVLAEPVAAAVAAPAIAVAVSAPAAVAAPAIAVAVSAPAVVAAPAIAVAAVAAPAIAVAAVAAPVARPVVDRLRVAMWLFVGMACGVVMGATAAVG